MNTNAGPSAALTTPTTSTTSIRSPTDTTSLCIISTTTYVGQRVVYLCLCVSLTLRSSAIAKQRRTVTSKLTNQPTKVRFSPSESESTNRSSITSLHVNFLLAIVVSCSNLATPLPQTGSVAHCLRSLTPQFAWDFLERFALKRDTFLS